MQNTQLHTRLKALKSQLSAHRGTECDKWLVRTRINRLERMLRLPTTDYRHKIERVSGQML